MPTLVPPSADGGVALPAALAREIRDLPSDELLGGDISSEHMAAAVRAGLLLRADLLEESHSVSQTIPTAEGSYWHGIMHRREPDYGNAKYWFRRVGAHQLFETLARSLGSDVDARALVAPDGEWDPCRFVDLCEACGSGSRADLRQALEELQALEIDHLLEFCAARALATG